MRRRTVRIDGPDPIDRYVGSRVRARRVGLRMSQTKLGNAIGVTFQQIQKYENGANRIGASNLFKIGQALGVEVSFFFDGMPDFDKQSKARGKLSDGSQEQFNDDPMTSREAIAVSYTHLTLPTKRIV